MRGDGDPALKSNSPRSTHVEAVRAGLHSSGHQPDEAQQKQNAMKTMKKIGGKNEIFPRFGMLTSVMVVILVPSWVLASPSVCCPKNVLSLMTKKCVDGERPMNCSAYLNDPLDGDPEHWYNEKEDRLIIGTESYASDRYCLFDSRRNDSMVLLCADLDKTADEDLKFIISGIFILISVFFLAVNLIIHFLLPELRDLQGKCLMSYVFTLMVGFLILATFHLQIHTNGNDIICITQAFFLYYWMLASFFWLSIVAYNIWRTIRTVKKGACGTNEEQLFQMYCLFGWGMPLLFLIVSLVAHHLPGNHLKPGFDQGKCWFEGKVETWSYFYGPAVLLMISNLIFFCMTGLEIIKPETTKHNLRSIRYRFYLYFKMFVIMGLSWFFEIISYLCGDQHMLWYILDIFNCLHGFWIFLLTIVCRKRALKAIRRKFFKNFSNKIVEQLLGGEDEESERNNETSVDGCVECDA